MRSIYERVGISLLDHVAGVSVSDVRTFAALDAAGTDCVRAEVVSGEGPCFSAGLDLTEADALASDEGRERILQTAYEDANLFQRAALAWRELTVPVIAALHGSVFAGGLRIALGADLRYRAPDAQLAAMEMRWSLVHDMAASLLLRGLVRPDIARELIYAARKISAEEALLMVEM
jgi:enoyl-CoA hydratase/carnithine racemase